MKKIVIFIITLNIIFLFNSYPIYAASDPSKGIGCGGGLGPIGEFICQAMQGNSNPQQSTIAVSNKLGAVISGIVLFMSAVASLWMLFQIIIAGYEWIGSGGDKTSLENARNKITYSIIGLIIIVMATTLVGLIGMIFKIPILNPGETLLRLMQ